MNTESCQDELCIRALISVETYCDPTCTLPPGWPSSRPGCSSSPLSKPGSMNDTEGRVPFATSLKYSETGTMLFGYLLAAVNMLSVLSCIGGVAWVKSVT